MKCPNCQKAFEDGVRCPHCDVDTVLYMGTVRLSDKLHNQGLERLRNGDLYHGIAALTKSVAINKNNVPSRNLLGLALFEVGHVGEALKHWVISQSMLREDNAASRYIESAHKNARQLERLNDAAYMFNQALGHIKHKSDDLAIIQLKKATEINPNFVDAFNLLTLCYLIQNDKDRASSMVQRVLSLDAYNPIALNYHSLLNPGKRPPRQPSAKTKNVTSTPQLSPYKPIGLDERKPRNFHFAELMTFVLGVACTLVAGYFMLVPEFNRRSESDRITSEMTLADVRAELNVQLAERDSMLESLRQEIADMEAENRAYTEQAERAERISQVEHSYALFRAVGDEDSEENLLALRSIIGGFSDFNRFGLNEDVLELVDIIFEEAYPRIGIGYYNSGLAAFSITPHRDSYRALRQLENARRFLSEDTEQWNRMLFMLGTLYLDLEEPNYEEAEAVLTELYERSPGLPNQFTGTERIAFAGMMARIEGQQ